MKMQLLGVVLALAGYGASAAKADWEYTKWGMTPQQVIDASKDLAKPSTDPNDLLPDSDGNVSKLVAPYQSGKFSFEAQFGFNAADKLASVTLVLYDKSVRMLMDTPNMDMSHTGIVMNMNMSPGICNDLQASLFAAYGLADKGGTNMNYGEWNWQDQKTRNNVSYTVLYEVGCYVQYNARK
jgi:hypothetical protein